ncbi:MAG: hypothetical protein DMG59_13325 [Acidobacteria bacterium]|nr:MAG: hypothetical protein DMG59_13325 [Acidobacteriota bacterium]
MEESTPLQVLANYYRAFSTHDTQAVLPFFHEPALFIGPQGVYPAPNSAAVASAVTPTLEQLRARDFDRSELSVNSVTSLSATATVATGVAIRYKTGGEELERVGRHLRASQSRRALEDRGADHPRCPLRWAREQSGASAAMVSKVLALPGMPGIFTYNPELTVTCVGPAPGRIGADQNLVPD